MHPLNENQTRRPLTDDDLFTLCFVQDARLSPDGWLVAYAVLTSDEAEDADRCHLWLFDLDSRRARQLTHGQQQDKSPHWSPDGSQLAFLSTRGERPQIYVLPLDGGEARQLTFLSQGVGSGPFWSPDGAHIAFTAGPEQQDDKGPQPRRITRFVYRFDSIGYLDQEAQDIYVVNAAGGQPQRLTSDDASNGDLQWSPDGSEILYGATMLPDTPRALHPRLRIVDLQGNMREVLGDWGAVVAFAWMPDGRRIAFAGTPGDKPLGSKADLFVMDVSGNRRPENRTVDLDVGVGGRLQVDMPSALVRALPRLLVGPHGQHAFIQVQVGGQVPIYVVRLEGPQEHGRLVHGDHACYPLDLSKNGGRLLYAATTFNSPLDLFVVDSGDHTLDMDTGHNRHRQITELNASVLAGLSLPGVEHLVFPGPDGTPVEGWMLLPPAGNAPYPTVLYIHGGPHSSFGTAFHCDMQMLAGARYGVLLVNQRASTGYGDAFATAIKGDWGNLDYGDLMAGVDAAIARGLADPDRLGVCGLSGGGNLACWIVGQTSRFRAAVPENPLTNWVSFYGVSDIGVWFAVEELGGRPHEIPEIYARCSPITHAHKCRTPTLLVQGESDWRCPAEQSEQFYTVLKANGCIAEMLRLPESPHAGAVVGKPSLRRAQNDALLQWMDRHVLGR